MNLLTQSIFNIIQLWFSGYMHNIYWLNIYNIHLEAYSMFFFVSTESNCSLQNWKQAVYNNLFINNIRIGTIAYYKTKIKWIITKRKKKTKPLINFTMLSKHDLIRNYLKISVFIIMMLLCNLTVILTNENTYTFWIFTFYFKSGSTKVLQVKHEMNKNKSIL